MKIAYLTAGAAGMICGSCLHDNALAKSLIRLGHDCVLIPAYTPIRTDDEDVSIDRVFMGGINVYLQQKLPWLANMPKWFDSFLNQSWIIQPLTKNAGKTSPALLGALTISMLRGTQGRQRKEFRRLLDWLLRDIQPDVMVFTNLLVGGGIPELKRLSQTKVFVTLQGDDIFLDSLPTKYRQQAIELMQNLVSSIDGFLIHSQDYAVRMASLLKIPANKIHIVPLGIDVTDFRNLPRCLTRAAASAVTTPSDPSLFLSQSANKVFTIGYLARMAPEKGLHRLVDAFISIANRPEAKHVQLKLAGWMGPQHAEFWNEQKSKLEKSGLSDRWEYLGSIDRAEKAKFLTEIDLFCVPTTYTEPKGLFLLEAIAAGTPYLQPDHGAFPEIHRRMQTLSPGRSLGSLFKADSMDDLNIKLLDAIKTNARTENAPEALFEEIDITKHAQRVVECFEPKL